MKELVVNHPTEPPHRWRDRALCLGADAELWFPIDHTGPALKQANKAKAICRACPVAVPCLIFALEEMPGSDGIWAGTDPETRQRMRKEIGRRKAVITCAPRTSSTTTN